MKILPIAILAAAVLCTTACCRRAKVADIVTDEYNQDILALTGAELDSFEINKNLTADIFSIKHGSLAVHAGGKWLYFDPVGKAAQPVTDFSQFPKADYIFITHDHGDHFDPEAIAQLSQEGTKVICNKATAEKAAAIQVEGVTNLTIAALGNGESFTSAEGWQFDAVPAYNNTEGKLNFHPQGVGNGYVVDIEGFRIYVAGDTEVIPELSEIKDIDVAFLPCNLPYTMTPDQCAEAARTVAPKVLFPYHYSDTDLLPLTNILDGSGIDIRIRSYK